MIYTIKNTFSPTHSTSTFTVSKALRIALVNSPVDAVPLRSRVRVFLLSGFIFQRRYPSARTLYVAVESLLA